MLFAISLASCSSDKEDVSAEIKPNKESLSFPKEGGTEILYVQSNTTLEINSSESWCSIKEESSASASNRKFSITAAANPETDERLATLTFSDAGISRKVDVVQAAATRFIIKNPVFNVSGEGGVISVEMSVSGAYEMKINNEDWIRPVSTKAMSDKTEQFLIDKNQMAQERTGTITFTMADITETVTVTQSGIEIPAPDKTGMESDATTLAKKIFMGWNLGNSLEAPGSEVAWGNPRTTKAMIDVVKASGFNAVRIPCAWDNYLEDQITYKIKESWFARVKEVVNYCVDNDMYAIINIHWDGGWLENNCTPDKQEEVTYKQHVLWTQIASYFRDYDEHLLFAGCNEPNVDSPGQMAVLKAYEQTFIDAVRATGGRNAYRNLIVQGPGTDIDNTDNLMDMPADSEPGRLMMEVHYYSPWLFCILEEDGGNDWNTMHYFWGRDFERYATGEYAGRWSGEWGEEYVNTQFQKMKTRFADNGIPVILGEFGAVRRILADPVIQQAHDESRAYFFRYIMEQSKNHGLVPFFWDNGGSNKPLFDRMNGMTPDPLLLNAMVEGAEAGNYPF